MTANAKNRSRIISKTIQRIQLWRQWSRSSPKINFSTIRHYDDKKWAQEGTEYLRRNQNALKCHKMQSWRTSQFDFALKSLAEIRIDNHRINGYNGIWQQPRCYSMLSCAILTRHKKFIKKIFLPFVILTIWFGVTWCYLKWIKVI